MTPATHAKRQILVIAGSGRSGTSLFTGLTSRLGLYVPQPEVKANRSNPSGFSEPRWAVDFHNDLLQRADVLVEDGRPEAWDLTARIGEQPQSRARLVEWLETQFAEAPRIVVKDPRLAWFFQLYRDAAAEAGADLRVATMLRDPAEVLRSREMAYGTKTSNNTRAVGWVNMMLGIESRTRDLPRATIAYADVLADWRSALAVADDQIGLGLISGASDQQLAHTGELVDPNLRRSVVSWDEIGLSPSVRELTERTYATFGRLVGVPADQQDPVRKELDDLVLEFREMYDEAFEFARHRVGGTVRRERRRAIRNTRQQVSQVQRTGSGPAPSILTRARRKARSALGKRG